MAKILRKSLETHNTQVQENAKKITVHLLYMPEIEIGSFVQTLVERSGLVVNSHEHNDKIIEEPRNTL